MEKSTRKTRGDYIYSAFKAAVSGAGGPLTVEGKWGRFLAFLFSGKWGRLLAFLF